MQELINYKSKLFVSGIFAIAMAYLESAVVVYLRGLYYPDGFQFPLIDIPLPVLLTEIGREAATIVMLWAIARMLAKNGREWFAYFAFNFGVWDIWYYLWLKILLNWPASILEWDILFLIPVPWLAPVLAPVLVSIALIFAAIVILNREEKDSPLIIPKAIWFFEIIAGLIIIISFITELDVLEAKQVPQYFPWWLFFCGYLAGLSVFLWKVFQSNKKLR